MHLRGIADYISRDNPAAAARVLTSIDAAVKRLADFPFSCRRGARKGSYELVLADLPYIVVYRVVREHVDSLGVFHTSLDPSIRSRP